MAISFASMALNVALAFLFVWLLSFANSFQQFIAHALDLASINNIGVVGLALAMSVSGLFQCLLLLLFLRKTLGHIRLKEITRSFLKTVLATVLMGVTVYASLKVSAGFVAMETFLGILIQTGIAGIVGVIVYFLATRVLKSSELATIKLPFFHR